MDVTVLFAGRWVNSSKTFVQVNDKNCYSSIN